LSYFNTKKIHILSGKYYQDEGRDYKPGHVVSKDFDSAKIQWGMGFLKS